MSLYEPKIPSANLAVSLNTKYESQGKLLGYSPMERFFRSLKPNGFQLLVTGILLKQSRRLVITFMAITADWDRIHTTVV